MEKHAYLCYKFMPMFLSFHAYLLEKIRRLFIHIHPFSSLFIPFRPH